MKHVFRFFLKEDFTKESLKIKDSELIRRILKVLRLSKGDEFYLFDGNGTECLVKIIDVSKKEIIVKILKKEIKEEKYKINIFPALIRKNRFEWMVEKAVEIGIKSINPVICSRSEIKKIESRRIEKIMIEAAEQSKKFFIPRLNSTKKLNEVLNELKGTNIVLFNSNFSKKIFELKDLNSDEINLFIGPEGDFTDDEINLFKQNNFIFLSLGKENLRSETATIAGILALKYLNKSAI